MHASRALCSSTSATAATTVRPRAVQADATLRDGAHRSYPDALENSGAAHHEFGTTPRRPHTAATAAATTATAATAAARRRNDRIRAGGGGVLRS